jgi:uncharacterized membrane protein YjjP (DUF1212 family)
MTKNFPKEWGSFLVQIYLLCLAIRISNIWKSKMQLEFPAYLTAAFAISILLFLKKLF